MNFSIYTKLCSVNKVICVIEIDLNSSEENFVSSINGNQKNQVKEQNKVTIDNLYDVFKSRYKLDISNKHIRNIIEL